MKQKIMAIAAIIMASFAINTVHAQTIVNNELPIVNNKIQAKFQKAFPDAEQTTWVAIKNGYEARFLQNGITTVVGYNKAGRTDYMVERYGADRLPSATKTMVNDAYREYDIVNAIEVHLGDKISYLVNIESKKFRKIIRINDDGMDLYKDMAITHQ